MADIRDFTELRVYVAARDAAMRIFEISKRFPSDERLSLTLQLRRSSRSVCANIAEGWQKRRYPASFRSKIVDAAAEADETRAWIDFAERCGFMSHDEAATLTESYRKVLGHLVRMSARPEDWRIR